MAASWSHHWLSMASTGPRYNKIMMNTPCTITWLYLGLGFPTGGWKSWRREGWPSSRLWINHKQCLLIIYMLDQGTRSSSRVYKWVSNMGIRWSPRCGTWAKSHKIYQNGLKGIVSHLMNHECMETHKILGRVRVIKLLYQFVTKMSNQVFIWLFALFGFLLFLFSFILEPLCSFLGHLFFLLFFLLF